MFYDRLKRMCEGYGDSIAFGTIQGKKLTYREFFEEVEKDMGLFAACPYQRIGLMGMGSSRYVALQYAALCTGRQVILLDPFLERSSQLSLMDYTDVELLLQDEEDPELKELAEQQGRAYRSFSQLENGQSAQPIRGEGTMLFFTSGTSSHAKGAVLSPTRFWDGLEQSIPLWNNEHSYTVTGRQRRLYIPLTLNHVYGSCMCLVYLMQGFTIFFGNPRRMMLDLKTVQPDELVGVASFIPMLLQMGVGSVRRMMCSGGPCSRELAEKAAQAGMEIRNIYGASEIGGVAFNPSGYPVDHLLPFAQMELKIGEDGLIWMRTPLSMLEYYKKPEESSRMVAGQWMTLEDEGGQHEDGSIYVGGRRSQMIAMENGDKIYVAELEERLGKLPGVAEAAILYENHKIVAALLPQPGTDSRQLMEGVKEYNRAQTYQFKIGEVWLRERSLPRSNMGKVHRSALREQYQNKEKQE